MKEFDWNFFMYHFQVTDALQHHVYHIIDPSRRELGKNEQEQQRIILDFYKRIDRRIGELPLKGPARIPACVLSDHGFLSLQKAFYLNHWLHQQGYLVKNSRYFLVKQLDNFVHLAKTQTAIFVQYEISPQEKILFALSGK